jgi:hypothetical protein
MWQAWFRWIWCHRTKCVGILGVIAGCTQNYLANNNIAFIPAAWHGVLLAIFGAVTFLVGLYNSVRDAANGPEV